MPKPPLAAVLRRETVQSCRNLHHQPRFSLARRCRAITAAAPSIGRPPLVRTTPPATGPLALADDEGVLPAAAARATIRPLLEKRPLIMARLPAVSMHLIAAAVVATGSGFAAPAAGRSPQTWPPPATSPSKALPRSKWATGPRRNACSKPPSKPRRTILVLVATSPKPSGTAAQPPPLIVQIERAVELEPKDSTLVVRRGEMLLATGATERSLQCADDAIRSTRSSPPLGLSAAALIGKLDQSERALADLQRSLQFAPDQSDVLMDIAALYRQRGQHDRCLTTLQHLLDTYPPGQGTQLAYWMEGLTLSDLGRPQQAAESLRIASQQGPPNADILYYLAQAELAGGRPDAAATAAQQALAINPSHAPSRQLLTELAARSAGPAPIVR